MSLELTRIIEYGNDITMIKYYGVAATTVLFYEYFLMLPDEIRFVWPSNKTWVFYLFLLNRYGPMPFQLWVLTRFLTRGRCNKTSFLHGLAFVTWTLVAQIVLALRIYAVTGKSRPIAIAFAMITASQLTLGIYLTFLAATHPAEAVLPIPFDAFRICVYSRRRKLEISYTLISLVYDLFAFFAILRLSGWWTVRRFGVPGLLGTILKDATKYFLVIFTAHLILTMTLLFAKPSLQLLPISGNVVYLPVMITRLMISLRKAAQSQGSAWSMGEATNHGPGREMHSMRFAPNRAVSNTRDDHTLVSSISP